MGITTRIHDDFIHLVTAYEMGNGPRFFEVIQGKISYVAEKLHFREMLKVMQHEYSRMCQT